MIRIALALGAVTSLLAFGGPNETEAGDLLVVGGGGTPASAIELALESTGPEAPVAVVPWASAREDAGASSVEMWLEAGYTDVVNLAALDAADARAALDAAEFVWMPGGSQTRLMEALRERDLVEAVRARHEAGALVGGTSAGAAVMSAVMISGESGLADLGAGVTEVFDGLGLWPQVVVDQHFVERSRYNRLLSGVLDHPELVGVGIGERTAVLVQPSGDFRVIGEGNVFVVDAREARISGASEPGEPASARGLRVDVLRAGDAFAHARAPRDGER